MTSPTYTYNYTHQVTTRTDAKNQQTQYDYDGYGRVTEVRHGTMSGGTFTEDVNQRVDYTYDSGTYGQGRLTGVTSASQDCLQELYYGYCDAVRFQFSYGYNQAGRVTGQSLMPQRYVASTYSWNNVFSSALSATYGWDTEGGMTSLGYPQLVQSGYSAPAAPTNTYDYDNMSRLADVQQDWGSGPGIVAQAVTYGPAGELINFNYFGVTEARTYNQMLQLTRMTATAGGTLMDMQYNYSSTQNDGRITGAVDSVTGENTTYTYDALNRLTGASVSSGWATTYGYDGFGNLTAKNVVTGPAPTLGVSYDANNHQIGLYYDANGNQTQDAAGVLGYGWDVENRMTGMAPISGSGPWNAYSYDPWGKRVLKHYHDTSGTDQQEYSFYGVTGQRLAVVFCDVSATPPCTISYDTYFGGKQVRTGMTGSGSGSTKVTDRLGSVRWNGAAISYYPYGEEKTTTADGTEKFGTYFRDGFGQDYADQRYYNSDRGRFWSVDPGAPSYGNPGSLNRYAFVSGDPVNGMDRHGMMGCFIGIDSGCGDQPAVMTGDGGLGPCDVSQSQVVGGLEWGFVEVSMPPGCDTPNNDATAPPGPAAAAPPPDCSLKLEYRSAGITGVAGRTHSSLVVQDQYGFTFTIQGEPHRYPLPPWGNLDISNTPGDINNKQWGSTLTSALDTSLCDQIDQIETAELYYSAHEVSYNPSGPNSNSLVNWLLQSGGLGQYFSAPPGSTGWSVSLYGHLF